MNDQPPVAPDAPAATKKGIPVLGWVGLGCGTMIVIAIVAMSLLAGWCKRSVGNLADFKDHPEKASAEMMVKMNPDLQKVAQDDAKGEMTIRTKDGQEMTLSYKDVAGGKFMIRDAKGNSAQIGQADLSNVPAWVPRAPNIKTTTGSFQNKEEGKISGLYNATSTASAGALEEFFKTQADKLKLTESSRTSMNVDGVENRILAYEGDGRTLNIVINGKPGEDVQINVAYEEEK
jgi:hypothetical protein